MLWLGPGRTFILLSSLGLAGACTTGSAERRPDAIAGHPVPQSITLASGVRLQYVEQGKPDGIPVVLLHGYSDSWHSWERVLPLLPGRLRVFAFSQRGHGESDRPESGYQITDLSTDLEQFLDGVGVRSVVIVGHSMGSGVARRFALDRPERVRGLVLEGAFGTWKGNPLYQEFWDQTISRLEDPIDRSFAVEFQRSTLKRPVPEEFFNMVVGETLKLPARVHKELFQGFMAADFGGETRIITAPTLILWGDQDAYTDRKDQQVLLDAIPGSRLVTYIGTGHGMHWEEPERFVRDLIGFVATLK